MKSLTLDSLVEKVEKHEKDFKKNTTQSIGETMFLAQKREINSHDSSRGGGSKPEDVEEGISKEGG